MILFLNFTLWVQCVMNAVVLIRNEMLRKVSNANVASAQWFLINTPTYSETHFKAHR